MGISPRLFFSRIRSSIVTAFSTSSSSATLPTNLAVIEKNIGVPPSIAGFVLPIGSTMCMNGTSLFEGITVLFIEQNVELALTLAHRGYILESGRTVLDGPSAALLRSPEVRRIFLGG